MEQLKNYREVGIFDLISAPLTPIGAFDAEQFKKDVRSLLASKPDEKFLAVDLSGLDFVYSDAYNAFSLFQQEMASCGGAFAILVNNKVIIDGLKKAGLDKSIKIFTLEADMMSFSLQSQTKIFEDFDNETKAVASQNINKELPKPHSERRTGQHKRFTKSFNAITTEKSTSETKGLDSPFDEEPSSTKTVLIVILLLLAAVGGTLAFFYI